MPEPVLAIGILAGYSALYAAARGNSAVSNEALAIRSSAMAAVQTTERSHALFGEKATAISQIWALADECSERDWNGEDAEPLDRDAASIAADFVRALPDGVRMPEFASEPDGSISLDWIESRHRQFSLSVARTSRLAFAWLDGADKGHGVAAFDRMGIPVRVLQGIQSIVKNADTSLRAA
jgi:hypothetical protein